MIQFAMIISSNISKTSALFKLPISIGRLVVYSPTSKPNTNELCSIFYLQALSGTEVISLFDSSQELLASVTGVEFMPTTLAVLDRTLHSIQNQNAHCPIYELEWVSSPNYNKWVAQEDTINWFNFNTTILTNKESEIDLQNLQRADQLMGLLLWREFLRAGFDDVLGQFTVEDVMSHFQILPQFKNPAERYLRILLEDRHISMQQEKYCIDCDQFVERESIENTEKSITTLVEKVNSESLPFEIQAAFYWMPHLFPILRGEESVLSLLFPDKLQDQFVTAETIYTKSTIVQLAYKNLSEVFCKFRDGN